MTVTFNAKNLPSNGGNVNRQEPLEPGTYPARLTWLVLMGVQDQGSYQGKEKPPALEMLLGYEFLDEFCVDGEGNLDETKPRFISETFPFHSLKADRARSTKRYMSLDPSMVLDGDWEKLVGCVLNLTINSKVSKSSGNTYNNVSEVSKMRDKDFRKYSDAGVLDVKVFNLYEPNIDVFLSLPQWIQDKIKSALDFSESPLEALLKGVEKEDKTEAPVSNMKAPSEEDGDNDQPW